MRVWIPLRCVLHSEFEASRLPAILGGPLTAAQECREPIEALSPSEAAGITRPKFPYKTGEHGTVGAPAAASIFSTPSRRERTEAEEITVLIDTLSMVIAFVGHNRWPRSTDGREFDG